MGDMLSQAEIDALLGDGNNASAEPQTSTDLTPGPAQPIVPVELDGYLSEDQKDVLGEIGNISMGTSATTLFALLGQKVLITTPRVKVLTWGDLSKSYARPCVGIRVDYTEGLKGSNMLVLNQRDVKIITSLMMGGDGQIAENEDLTELDLSAIGEAMNQMIGSSSTSLSSMLKMRIDIATPSAFILDFNNEDILDTVAFAKNDIIACISFRMEIGNVIDSDIMQIIPVEFAKEMVETLRSDIMITTPEPSSPPPAPASFAQPAPPPAPPQQDAVYQQPAHTQTAPPPHQPVNVQPVQFQNLDLASVMQQKENIGIIMDVPLEITVELGRTRKKIKEILEFTPGTIVELDKLAGEPIDILVNGKFVAKGEVVVIDENFGIRLTDIVNVENRI